MLTLFQPSYAQSAATRAAKNPVHPPAAGMDVDTIVELGKKMLRESGLSIISAEGLTDAAKQAVAAVA